LGTISPHQPKRLVVLRVFGAIAELINLHPFDSTGKGYCENLEHKGTLLF
jgi:hypothetical protein